MCLPNGFLTICLEIFFGCYIYGHNHAHNAFSKFRKMVPPKTLILMFDDNQFADLRLRHIHPCGHSYMSFINNFKWCKLLMFSVIKCDFFFYYAKSVVATDQANYKSKVVHFVFILTRITLGSNEQRISVIRFMSKSFGIMHLYFVCHTSFESSMWWLN